MVNSRCLFVIQLSALAILAGCSGGTGDEGRATPTAAAERPPSGSAPLEVGVTAPQPPPDWAPAAAVDANGAYPGVAAPNATAPVAPHSTRLFMLEDGLYARDEADNWRKLTDGVWVSVQAPQGVTAQ